MNYYYCVCSHDMSMCLCGCVFHACADQITALWSWFFLLPGFLGWSLGLGWQAL